VANWEGPASGRGPGGFFESGPRRACGLDYLQKNGVPYSATSSMTEYFDVVKEPTWRQWLVVKSVFEDPVLSDTNIHPQHAFSENIADCRRMETQRPACAR
jgi:hypothetical protein